MNQDQDVGGQEARTFASIKPPPDAGDGVHYWLFKTARQLHAKNVPALEIINLLEQKTAACGRVVPRGEIVDAVRNSIPVALRAHRTASQWPTVNDRERQAIVENGGGLRALQELSRDQLPGQGPHTEAIIDRLFPGNPLLCCGKSQSLFATVHRDRWRTFLSGYQFIVPSPMSAMTGRTKDGHESKHTLANTGPRRFLVVEFDQGPTDEHAALLLHLAEYAPLVCVVHSGNKSLHGWFFVAGQPEEKVLRFFRFAVSLGADHATWCRSQFVRMPDGTRDNGKRQAVYFLNFNPLKTQ